MLIIKDNDFEIMYNRTVIGEAIRVTRGADNMQCGKKKSFWIPISGTILTMFLR